MASPSHTMAQRGPYSSDGRCIYCAEYFPALTKEHIIPESLSGSWWIIGACKDCAEKSNKEYEATVLQSDMVRAMRAFLALRRKKGKKKPPITMPPVFAQGTASKTILQQSDYLPDDENDGFYPRIFTMLALEPALKLVDASSQTLLSQRPIRLWLRNIEDRLHPGPIVMTDPATIADAYVSKTDFMFAANVTINNRSVSIRQRFPTRKFMRMLTKIAYCFAVAEHGIDKYKNSPIRKLVLGERDDYHDFVGGALNGDKLTSRYLHHLAFRQRGNFQTVLVHLFASYQAPPYEVIIDEIAKSARAGTPC